MRPFVSHCRQDGSRLWIDPCHVELTILRQCLSKQLTAHSSAVRREYTNSIRVQQWSRMLSHSVVLLKTGDGLRHYRRMPTVVDFSSEQRFRFSCANNLGLFTARNAIRRGGALISFLQDGQYRFVLSTSFERL